MNHMFNNCEKLKSLNLLNFNTQNVTNMSGMFYGCKELKNLNLSNFKTHNDTSMNNMFKNCEQLKKEKIVAEDKILSNFHI